jgi:gamma-glutamyltranspeptidase/glutathione hydrolase
MLEFELDANDAVNKPKFHHQWFPDVIFVEKDFPASSREQLEKMGYKITIRGQIGRTELIQVASDGKVIAVADKRGDDHAEGYE